MVNFKEMFQVKFLEFLARKQNKQTNPKKIIGRFNFWDSVKAADLLSLQNLPSEILEYST